MLYAKDKKCVLFRDADKKYTPLNLYKGNKKIAGWKEQSFNATSVSQNDTYNDSAYLKIYGKSEQVQTTQGKNLFDAYNYVTSYPDDIKPVNQDGEDWIKMQSSAKQARYNFNAKENTQYTFTFEFKRYDDSGSYSANFVLYYTDGTSETLDFGYYSDENLHKVSRKSAKNKTISYIRNANNGNTVYFLLRVNGSQIEEGITATAYSPFVPNSPSPEYPSTINSVNNFDLVSSGKNLANINSLTLNGTEPSNGIVFSGVSPANTVFHFVKKEESVVKPSSALFRIAFIDDTFEYVTGRYTQTAILIKPVKEIKCLNWGGIVGTIDNIQLELGTVATPYTPFRGLSTINFPYTLRSLPDGTADYAWWDNEKGEAWYQPLTWEMTLTNNTSYFVYTYGSDLDNLSYYCSVTMPSDKLVQKGCSARSDRFPKAGNYSWSVAGIDENVISTYYADKGGGKLYCKLSKLLINQYEGATTLDKIKSFFGANPTVVQYQIATPPEPIQLDYEAVKTYYPYTQIYTTAAVQPTLEGKLRVIDRD